MLAKGINFINETDHKLFSAIVSKMLLSIIESLKTTSMEDIGTRVLEKIKNI